MPDDSIPDIDIPDLGDMPDHVADGGAEPLADGGAGISGFSDLGGGGPSLVVDNTNGAPALPGTPVAPPRTPMIVNTMGERVSSSIHSLGPLLHTAHALQGGDFCGYELVVCTWTSTMHIRRTRLAKPEPEVLDPAEAPPLPDVDGDPSILEDAAASAPQLSGGLLPVAVEDCVEPVTDANLDAMRMDISVSCVHDATPPNAQRRRVKPAVFVKRDFRDAVDALLFKVHDSADPDWESVYAPRTVNTAWTLMEEFVGAFDPADPACVAEWKRDAWFLATWFLREWGAEAETAAERRRIRRLSVRMLVNVVDRILHPGRGLKVWPCLCGRTNLGKTMFEQNVLPRSMKRLHASSIDLTKSRDHLVRELYGTLLCEIPELAEVNHSHVGALKRNLNMAEELAELKWRNYRVRMKTTTAFIGSMNPNDDIFPPTADEALLERLPLIPIASSPWGRAVPVVEQLEADGEALRRRLWRGALYWRLHARVKFDPVAAPSEEESAITVALGWRHVHRRVTPAEYAAVAHRILAHAAKTGLGIGKPAVGDALAAMRGEGAYAADISAVLREEGHVPADGRDPSGAVGRALAKDTRWFKAGYDAHAKTHLWSCRAVCEADPSLVVPGGAVEAAWRGAPDVPDIDDLLAEAGA